MPKRSNEFQALVHRIESVMHDAPAKVEESALVLNETTGKTEEIDVVVSFEVGGRSYRTGVAVRQRTRDKGDKEWIRALAIQRTECKLDRIVAVHSRGFSDSARKLAKTHNVELIYPVAIDDAELRNALLPVDGVEICRFRFLPLGFQLDDPTLKCDLKQLLLYVPGRTTFDEAALRDLVKLRLQQVISEDSETNQKLDSEELLSIRFRVPLKSGTEVELESGNRLLVTFMVGNVELQRVRATFAESTIVDYGGRTVLSSKGNVPASHLTTIPLDDGKVKVVARVPMNAISSSTTLEFPELRIEELE